MAHDAGRVCACVSEHRPGIDELDRHHVLPLAWGGPDTDANIEWLCPNGHRMVHDLLRAYQRSYGTPPWEVRRAFSPYTRALAQRGWDAYVAAQEAA